MEKETKLKTEKEAGFTPIEDLFHAEMPEETSLSEKIERMKGYSDVRYKDVVVVKKLREAVLRLKVKLDHDNTADYWIDEIFGERLSKYYIKDGGYIPPFPFIIMEKEKSLSEKIQHKAGVELCGGPFVKSYFEGEDVREAVLRLKEEGEILKNGAFVINAKRMDEILGEKLSLKRTEGQGA